MSNFKLFQINVKEVGYPWNGENIYYSQVKDGYYADYKPSYPDKTKEDMFIFWDGKEKLSLHAQIGCDGNEWIKRDFNSFEDLRNECK